MEYVTLRNGVKMPILGYGVYQVTQDECERCVLDALETGYRLIDTAQSYFNEEQVGSAIQKSGVPREEIFLTSKVWVEHYGYESARASVLESMRKLQVEYIDLMLLHQPFNDYYGAYRALEELYEEGKLRAIGVSNFYPDRLVDLASFTKLPPMVNQVETHVLNQQTEAKQWMDKYNVQIEAWAPFGEGRGGLFENPVLAEIGAKYGKTTAQVMLRWNIQRGEAGSTAAMTTDGIDTWTEDSKEYMPGDQAWYTHFRIGRVAPERYEGSQFPEGEEAQNQFFRQMTPNTGSYDEAGDARALGAVMDDVYEMTGNKAIYITHSQGGRVGWLTPAEHVSAIVAIEPGGTPEIGSEAYQALLDAKIPIAIYFGDYIENGPEDIHSSGFWKNVKDAAFAFAEAYNADGGDCTVADLPQEGITGSSHFMFQEMNNREIADHIENWLAERGLN